MRREYHDVAFYVPFIGDLLSSRTPSPPGGAETQILMLSQALARRGLRVAVVAYGEMADLPEWVEGVRIVARPPYNWSKGIAGKATEAARIWQTLWRVRSRTVVYRCASLELGLVGLYTALSRQTLVFSTANVADFFEFNKLTPKRRHRFLYHLGVRLADEIVVQTEEQIPLCEAAFHRHPYLIKSLSPLAEPTYVEPEAFLWAGRLVSYKQPLAYVELARAVPEARFRMVGVPPQDEGKRSLVREVAAAALDVPNLELLPPRPQAEIGTLMARAVASVNTALWEGMPNVLLEAWSRGVPALVLEHDPGDVVTRHQLGGFAGGSPERLAQLARELWHTRHDRSELAKRCRDYVATHHEPDAIARRWVALLASHRLPMGNEMHTSIETTCANGRQDAHPDGDSATLSSTGGAAACDRIA